MLAAIAAAVLLEPKAVAGDADGLEDPEIAASAPRVPGKLGEIRGAGLSGLPVVRRMRSVVAPELATA